MGTKKIVLRLDVPDDKNKQKVLKTVSTLKGVDSVSVDIKDGKVTVIGLVDPVDVVTKLRKNGWPSADLIAISPWPEKTYGDMNMNDVGGGGGGSGNGIIGGGRKKKKDGGKEELPKQQLAWHHTEQPSYQQRPQPPEWHTEQHPGYHHQRPQYVAPTHRPEKNPNECVIC